MSTFGKKALLSWNYNSGDSLRYVNTDKEIQLEILKKWYPIGEKFYRYGDLVEIVDYVLKFNSYFIVYITIHTIQQNNKRESLPVSNFEPSKEFLRNIKLKEILNDK